MSGRDELKLEFKVSAYAILNVCLFSILEDRMAIVSDIGILVYWYIAIRHITTRASKTGK